MHFDCGFDIGMQMYDHVEFTSPANRAFTHNHFRFLEFIDQIAVKASEISRAPTEPNSFPSADALAEMVTEAPSSECMRSLAAAQHGSGFRFIFGTLGFKCRDVVSGCRYGFAVRNQEIPAKAGLDRST